MREIINTCPKLVCPKLVHTIPVCSGLGSNALLSFIYAREKEWYIRVGGREEVGCRRSGGVGGVEVKEEWR